MTTQETTALLVIVQAEWPDIVITDDRIRIWSHLFEHHAYAEVEAALLVHMRRSKWPPKPSELLELMATAKVSGPPWEDAWAELMQAVRCYGASITKPDGGYIPPYENPFTGEQYPGRPAWPGWSSPEVEAAVRHIGYDEARMVDPESLSILRAQFRDAYESARRRRIEEAQIGGREVIDRLRSLAGSVPVTRRDEASDGPRSITAVVAGMRVTS